MPSTTSSEVSIDLASSMVTTPSLPTFSIASAMILPMNSSPLALTVPTWATSFWPLVGLEIFLRASTIFSTAFSMPRLISIGLCPAATILEPSRKIACASTVAVVVPSPAVSEVLEATSLTICAPRFANLSSSSISLATVTPSLVTVGAPHDFSMTTLRPRGPRVALTVSARMLTPSRIRERPASSNRISLADMLFSWLPILAELLFDDAEDVILAQDEVIDAVDLDLVAAVLAEEDAVALLDVERAQRALVVDLAVAGRDDLALGGLLLGRVRDDDPALGLLFLGDAANDDAVVKRTNFHEILQEPAMRERSRPGVWQSSRASARRDSNRKCPSVKGFGRTPSTRNTRLPGWIQVIYM